MTHGNFVTFIIEKQQLKYKKYPHNVIKANDTISYIFYIHIIY